MASGLEPSPGEEGTCAGAGATTSLVWISGAWKGAWGIGNPVLLGGLGAVDRLEFVGADAAATSTGAANPIDEKAGLAASPGGAKETGATEAAGCSGLDANGLDGSGLDGTEATSVALICEGADGAGASISGIEAREGGGKGRPDAVRLPVREGGGGATEGRPVRDGGGGATLGPNGMVRGGGRGALIRPTDGAVVVGALFASVLGTEARLLSSVMIACNPTDTEHSTPVVCVRFAPLGVSRDVASVVYCND